VAKYVPARAGSPAQLVLESNFDGFAVCAGWNGSEDSRFLDGADPAHPIPLSATSPAHLSALPAVAGDQATPGMKSIGCAGVSTEVWSLLKASADQALAPNSAAIVMSSFSRMRGDTIAEDHATSSSVP
jgi:hypothetical protein